MEFKKDSIAVKAWVRMIQLEQRQIADVPELGNLREVVREQLKDSE